MRSAKQLANLKRGNNPKKKGVIEFRRILAKELEQCEGDRNRLELFATSMVDKAIEGNHHYAAMLLDRWEGRCVEKVEMDVHLPLTYAQAMQIGKGKIESPRFTVEKPTEIIEAEFSESKPYLDKAKPKKTA